MPHPADAAGWDRGRLLATVTVVAVIGLLLAGGLGYGVYTAARDAPGSGGAPAGPGDVAAGPAGVRDRIAAAPMLDVDDNAARPAAPAAEPAPAMTMPAGTTDGPAGVRSGFPHTPEGAVAQLAAIEVAVLQTMSITSTTEVHTGWALETDADTGGGGDTGAEPGGGVAGWPLMVNVRAFLGGAQMTDTVTGSTTVQVTPRAAQVKGVDGPDWVLACVLAVVEVHVDVPARMGYGYCERMQWIQPSSRTSGERVGRWMIAPGPPPAVAPSTWPGTDLAAQAGWRPWTDPAVG